MAVAIRFNTNSASEYGTYAPGTVAVVPEDFAAPLLEGGYATLETGIKVDEFVEASEAQELADEAREAGFLGEADLQDQTASQEPESGTSAPAAVDEDDDEALAAALGASVTATTAPSIVTSTFSAAAGPEVEVIAGDGVASLTGGDLTEPTGKRKTGG